MNNGPSCIELSSGLYFDVCRPDHTLVNIRDIAHALSNLCRFNGHCREFYSVAQHSVLVSHIVPKPLAFLGLMHDAAEAYLGDISKPLKAELPDFKRMENAVLAEIRAHYLHEFHSFGEEAQEQVRHADLVALATEARDLMPSGGRDWAVLQGIEPWPHRIEVPLLPKEARRAFLDRFHDLWLPVAD